MAKSTKTKKTKPAKNKLDPTIEKMLADIQKKREDHLLRGREQLSVICPELFLIGVASCFANYDGEGDSGNIGYMGFLDVNQDPIPATQIPEKYRDALTNALYDLLPSGFEINDGSYGEVTIDIAKKEVKIEQNIREISTEYAETTFYY